MGLGEGESPVSDLVREYVNDPTETTALDWLYLRQDILWWSRPAHQRGFILYERTRRVITYAWATQYRLKFGLQKEWQRRNLLKSDRALRKKFWRRYWGSWK